MLIEEAAVVVGMGVAVAGTTVLVATVVVVGAAMPVVGGTVVVVALVVLKLDVAGTIVAVGSPQANNRVGQSRLSSKSDQNRLGLVELFLTVKILHFSFVGLSLEINLQVQFVSAYSQQ